MSVLQPLVIRLGPPQTVSVRTAIRGRRSAYVSAVHLWLRSFILIGDDVWEGPHGAHCRWTSFLCMCVYIHLHVCVYEIYEKYHSVCTGLRLCSFNSKFPVLYVYMNVHVYVYMEHTIRSFRRQEVWGYAFRISLEIFSLITYYLTNLVSPKTLYEL